MPPLKQQKQEHLLEVIFVFQTKVIEERAQLEMLQCERDNFPNVKLTVRERYFTKVKLTTRERLLNSFLLISAIVVHMHTNDSCGDYFPRKTKIVIPKIRATSWMCLITANNKFVDTE